MTTTNEKFRRMAEDEEKHRFPDERIPIGYAIFPIALFGAVYYFFSQLGLRLN
jgi:hypothetical protein